MTSGDISVCALSWETVNYQKALVVQLARTGASKAPNAGSNPVGSTKF